MSARRNCPYKIGAGLAIACLCVPSCGGHKSHGTPPGTITPYWTSPASDGTCPAGMSPCGLDVVQCYALDHDQANCGRCGTACTPGIACSAGMCQQVACSGPLVFSGQTVAPEQTGVPALVADMNGDGKLDLVRWDEVYGTVTVLLGNGEGGFSSGPSCTISDGNAGTAMFDYVAVGDFDEDGSPDLVMAVQGRSDAVELWLGNGDGSLRARQPHTGSFSGRVYVADVNRDGHLDVVTTNAYDTNLRVLLGWGDGTFTKLGTTSAGEVNTRIFIRDWDGDGIPDLLATGTTLHMLLGTGDGNFSKQLDCQVAVDVRSTVIADFNQDGKQDVATYSYSLAISVMLGDARCGLSARTDYPMTGVPGDLAAGDVTGDGIPDLVVSEWPADGASKSGQVVTLVGQGDGTFVLAPDSIVPAKVGGVFIGDYNGDGRADVLVDSYGTGVQVETNGCE
jgi:hypothetical protein